MRAPLATAALTLALLTSCGADVSDAAHVAPDTAPSTDGTASPEAPPPGEPVPVDRTRERSGPYDLVLTDLTVRRRDGRDRVVLRFDGEGRPGWAARYVDEAVLDGSGEVVDLDGDAVLQLDVNGTPTRPGAPDVVSTALAGDVVDARTVGAWEGVTQVFLGIEGARHPFRTRVLADPTRLVVTLD
jgi:hypothetical protein